MIPKISEELEQAVSNNPDGVIEVEGPNGTYWLMTPEAREIRTEVEKGLASIDRGEVVDYDPEKIKSDGRRILSQRSNDQ